MRQLDENKGMDAPLRNEFPEHLKHRWKTPFSRHQKIEPLPPKIRDLRQRSISLLVSNLHGEISKAEPKAMFYRAGRIVDSFIPVDRRTGKKRGFGFVRFKSETEASNTIKLAIGKSWGGKKGLCPDGGC